MRSSHVPRALHTGCCLVLALSTAAPVAAAQMPRLEPVTRVGCAACDGPEAFADIAGLAFGPDARILVLDTAEPYIRVFRHDGTHVDSFGTRGDGPGEFRSPSFLDVQPDGSLSVIDLRTRRRTRHAADGSELSVRPFGARFPLAAAASPNGDVWLATTDFRAPTLTIETWPAGADTTRVVRILSADFPMQDDTTPSYSVALAARPDGGFAIADGATFYHIGIFDASGRRVADVRRDIERVRRTPSEMAREEERRNRNAARVAAMRRAEGGPPGSPPPIPELKRHFLVDALHYDGRGRLWVRTERGTLDESVFDLFASDNRYIGEVRVPGRMRRFVIGDGLLAGIVYDADEAQYVQIYRISS